jgi:C4-dicarboxylate-specific signal transduction histidine kinase
MRRTLSWSLFSFLFVLVVGVMAIYAYAVILKSHNLEGFLKQAQNYSRWLDKGFIDHQILGTTRSFGLADKRFKRTVKGVDAPDNPDVRATLRAIRGQYAASIAYLMNAQGTVVACTEYDQGKTLTGENYAFRPYFQKAMQGRDYVYPALGVTTNRRGLYYASPIYDESQQKVIGVFVVKMGLQQVDRFLATINNPAVIISSSHIIFSSNQKAWTLKPLYPIDQATLEQSEDVQQFPQEVLNQSVGQYSPSGQLEVQGHEYTVISAPLYLSDPNGRWHLCVLIDSQDLLPPVSYAVGVAVIVLTCLVLWHLFNVREDKRSARLELKEQNAKLTKSEQNLKQANEDLLKNEEAWKALNVSLDAKVKERTKALEKEKNSLEVKVQERTRDLEAERKSLEDKVKKRTKELEQAKNLLEEKVRERTQELKDNLQSLKKTNQSMVGREKRIIELKNTIKDLQRKLKEQG